MWLFAFLNIQAFAKKEKTSLSGKEEGGPDLSSVHGVEKWTAPLQLEVARILAEICVLEREKAYSLEARYSIGNIFVRLHRQLYEN